MINKPKTQLTQAGFDKLVEELDLLKSKLQDAIDRVAKARAFGDLSENSEYHAAREDLAWMNDRMEELEAIINKCQIVKASNSTSTVSMGNIVTVTINDTDHEFTIVGEWEADPTSKKISHESPLGKALIGKARGDNVEVDAPVGKVIYTIKEIK
jgi:transcription elongation factor GreA